MTGLSDLSLTYGLAGVDHPGGGEIMSPALGTAYRIGKFRYRIQAVYAVMRRLLRATHAMLKNQIPFKLIHV